MLDAVDDVGVELLARLHLAEDDAPYANLGGFLLDRVFLDQQKGGFLSRKLLNCVRGYGQQRLVFLQ